MQNIFRLTCQKYSKINGAHYNRPGGVLYYSLCHNNITFRAWSSLFRKHALSKISMNKHNASILWAWTSIFHKHAPTCFEFRLLIKKTCMGSPPLYLLIINTVNGRQLRCPVITRHSFCQPLRLFQPPRLLTLEIFVNLPVYCTLPVYYFSRNVPASPFIPPSPSIWNSRVYAKGRHFSITMIDILIFCNILHLGMDFLSWKKDSFFIFYKLFDKSLVKNTIKEISEKME